jgi:hypothetical protein
VLRDPERPHEERARHRAVVLIVLMMGSVLFGLSMPGSNFTEDVEAAPNPIPILSLSLFPSQLQAKVTQSQLGAVTFGGNATVEKMPNIQRVTVTLQAVVNTGWPVVISPQTIAFVNPRTERFTVSVIVPPATSSTLTGNVMVTGTAKAPGLAPVVASASAVVTIAQYFKLRIEAEQPLREVKPGEITFNTVTVYNDGNGQDTFELEIENSKQLAKDQWTVLLGSTDVSILQDEYAVIKITAQTPQKWRLYAKEIHTITVKVTSAEGRSKNLLYAKDYPLFLYMKGTYIPGFSPLLVIIAIGGAVAVVGIQRQRQISGIDRRLN